jgi:hypothetical protein
LFLDIGRVDLDDILVAQIDMQFFKPVRRIPGSAPSMDRRQGRRCLLDDRDKLLFGALFRPWHSSSSHEHIPVSSGFSGGMAKPRP